MPRVEGPYDLLEVCCVGLQIIVTFMLETHISACYVFEYYVFCV